MEGQKRGEENEREWERLKEKNVRINVWVKER